MDYLSAYKIASSVVASMMGALWLCSLASKDASIVDRFWGAGFVLLSWAVFVFMPNQHSISTLLLALVTIWGLRLSVYIHLRNRGHGEDYRYAQMRSNHGSRFWWYSFFSVFCLQGVLMLLVASPVIFVMSQPEKPLTNSWVAVGALCWLTGFALEAGGDWQLSQFKANPQNKGKLLTSGMWSLSRHPNYFGDALQWWGFGAFALSYGFKGTLTLIGPVVMTIFLRKVSGVDLLEKTLKSSKPGYENYIASTPAFLPGRIFWSALIVTAGAAYWIFA